jgi:hypothetical protein
MVLTQGADVMMIVIALEELAPDLLGCVVLDQLVALQGVLLIVAVKTIMEIQTIVIR